MKNKTQAALAKVTPIRKPGKEMDAATEAMNNAISLKLTALLQEPITPAVLLRIEQTARIAREMLVVDKDPRALKRKEHSFLNSSYDSEMTVVSNTSSAETFGASVIREAIPAIAALMTPKPIEFPMDPVRLIEAISKAKKDGLHDIAAQLKKKLLGQNSTAPAVAPQKPAALLSEASS